MATAIVAVLVTGSVSAAEGDDGRVTHVVTDEASVTLRAVVDEHLDLATRLARAGEETGPLVPLAPRLVVGQGADPGNATMIRVLDRYGIAEAQFLAFESYVHGGVRVAAGRDSAGRAIIAATPIENRRTPRVRLFNDAGGLQREIEVADERGRDLVIALGDLLPDHPGDELAVLPQTTAEASSTELLLFGLGGASLRTVPLKIPPRQRITLSRMPRNGQRGDHLMLSLMPSRKVIGVAPASGNIRLLATPGLDSDQRVYPTAFDGDAIGVATGDAPLRSTLQRINADGAGETLDVGRMENQFHIAPGDWLDNQRGPYVTTAEEYAHIRTDMGNAGFARPGLWDKPGVWDRIGEQTLRRWGPLLRPLDQQPLRMWEPTMTHRMNRERAEPWAKIVDPATGLPRFLALTRQNQPTSYGEFGKTAQFHVFTYGYGDAALDQLYFVPLHQLLRRLAVRQRAEPERIFSLEPVHEHEIAVGGPGNVGDYHPTMIAGFREYLHRLYGDDDAIHDRLGCPVGQAFDAPRNRGRGPWDRYGTGNACFAAWVRFQRYVVNRRLADGFFAALWAGFPPEVIKSHQIPGPFAVGSLDAFSKRRTRITPVDYALTAGVGFGYTRYGVWFKRDHNMLQSAGTSGFAGIVLGEYQTLTDDPDQAYAQLRYMFDHGVSAIHVMHWPAANDKGYNAAMKVALRRLMTDQRPRPGLAGGVGRVVPVKVGDDTYDIAVLGTGKDRTGLLKSLRRDGSWQGGVYAVPFRQRIQIHRRRLRVERLGQGVRRYLMDLDRFAVGEQAVIQFAGHAKETAASGGGSGGRSGGAPRLVVLRGDQPLPGYDAELVVDQHTRAYRLTLRNQLPADGLTMAVDLPAGFVFTQRPEARLESDRVARPHRGEFTGEPNRGGVEFDTLGTP